MSQANMPVGFAPTSDGQPIRISAQVENVRAPASWTFDDGEPALLFYDGNVCARVDLDEFKMELFGPRSRGILRGLTELVLERLDEFRARR